MANRWFNQFRKALEKEVCTVFARVVVGAGGAVTLDAVNSKGVVSVTRNSAGLWTFVFGTKTGLLDTYNRLLDFQVAFDETTFGAAPSAPIAWLKANNIAVLNTSSLQIQLANSSGVATDPSSTEVVLFEFNFKNSTAP